MDKEKKFIVLDFDGTLIDTERVMLKSVVEYADIHGVPHDDDFMLQFVGASPADIAKILQKKFGEDFDAVGFLTGAIDYFNNRLLTEPTPLRPGAIELLDFLRDDGWTMALATSTYADIVDEELKFYDMKKYFSVIVTGDLVKSNKPAPEIYLKTTSLLGVEPKNCYAVEDSTVGIEAATTAGMKTLVIPDLHTVRGDLIPKCTGIFADCIAVIEYFKHL